MNSLIKGLSSSIYSAKITFIDANEVHTYEVILIYIKKIKGDKMGSHEII